MQEEQRSITHSPPAPVRKIIHVDLDAAFASIEQRDNPDLRGKPVAVGGSRERGVVAAASYEARRFGVRSAMPSVVARRKCPELIFVPPRFEVYRAVSRQIHEIFARYTPLIEPLSLDEAYLDVTANLCGLPTATRTAQEIRAAIKAETSLTASAGVSYCKFLAKLASDHRKPDGLFVIPPERGAAFVADLPVGRIHGVGPATEARMQQLGIYTGADLRNQSLEFLQAQFGKAGLHYHLISQGIDDRPVVPDRIRKSAGAETTFERDLTNFEDLAVALGPLVEKVWSACNKHGLSGRTVTLKVKFSDFQQITRSQSTPGPVGSADALMGTGRRLLQALYPLRRGIRLIGISLSGFDAAEGPTSTNQLTLSF